MLKIDRRSLVKYGLAASVGLFFNITPKTWAKTYMTEEQARLAIWNGLSMSPNPVPLNKAQKKAIKKATRKRVCKGKKINW